MSEFHLFIALSEQPPERIESPSDLVTSEVTAKNFRVSWRRSPGNVEKYRVVYFPVHGGQPQEVNNLYFVFKANSVMKFLHQKKTVSGIYSGGMAFSII